MEQIKQEVFSMGKEGWAAIEQPAGSRRNRGRKLFDIEFIEKKE